MKKTYILTIIPVCIAINIVGGLLATSLKLPIFLDSIGTMLSAVLLGPWLGALAGVLSNVLLGISDPVNIPYGLVNAVIGLIVGYIAMKRGFTDYITPIIVGVILAIVAPAIGAPISVYLFGGVTGGGIDLLYAIFLNQDMGIFTAAFLARVPANLVDKLLSAYLIVFIVRKLPPAMQGYTVKQDRPSDKPVNA